MGENIKTGIDAPYKNRYCNNAPVALPDCLIALQSNTQIVSYGYVRTSSSHISSNLEESRFKDIKPKNIYCLLDDDEDETTDEETASTASTASMSTIDSTTATAKYDFSCFKNQKYYHSWADADSSDDEK